MKLTVDDLVLQPRGPYGSNRWYAKSQVPTSFGDFLIEAVMPLKDIAPPDSEMIRQANELAEFTQNHSRAILNKIFEHYQLVAEPTEWFATCGVPLNLTQKTLAPYLEQRTLVVERGESDPTIYISPQWDIEHGLYLLVRKGRVQFHYL